MKKVLLTVTLLFCAVAFNAQSISKNKNPAQVLMTLRDLIVTRNF